MALTKIYTGMENGPESIDDNFNAINPEIRDTGWQALTIANTTGHLSIRRKGTDVWVSGGIVSTAAPVPATPVSLCTIPAGYQVDRTDGRYSFMSAFSPTKDVRYRFQNNGSSIKMLFSVVAADNYTVNWHWTTLDDFPD